MVMRAGTRSTTVSADNSLVDADQSAVTRPSTNISDRPGRRHPHEIQGTHRRSRAFREKATTIVIANLRQHTWLTTAGTFTLPGPASASAAPAG